MKNTGKIFICLILTLWIFYFGCTPYDHDIPDTQNNRIGFKKYLLVEPNNDIKNLFFYADEWCNDATYIFSFSAPEFIINKLIETLELKQKFDCKNEWFLAIAELPWWDDDEKLISDFYEFNDKKRRICRQLWYNPKTKNCQVAIIFW